MTRKPQRPCPGCKFPNTVGSTQCLQCQAPLEQPSLGWLCCESFEPRPLHPGRSYTIGRDATCDLVLPHKTLSRCHAVVSVVGTEIRFEDRSSNGSSVNGKRVKTATLVPGDVLQLGPFQLEIHADVAPESDDGGGGGNGTLVMNFSAQITGQLEDEPLLQTLQGFEFNSRTGTLEVLSGRARGSFTVLEGKPYFAELQTADQQDLRDEEAVLAMLALDEGRFTFTMGIPKGARRMNGTITGLLLEWSRRTDERETTDHG